jgi:hypothetical protein
MQVLRAEPVLSKMGESAKHFPTNALQDRSKNLKYIFLYLICYVYTGPFFGTPIVLFPFFPVPFTKLQAQTSSRNKNFHDTMTNFTLLAFLALLAGGVLTLLTFAILTNVRKMKILDFFIRKFRAFYLAVKFLDEILTFNVHPRIYMDLPGAKLVRCQQCCFLTRSHNAFATRKSFAQRCFSIARRRSRYAYLVYSVQPTTVTGHLDRAPA